LYSFITGANYTVTGDFDESPINGGLDGKTKTIPITLTAGYGIKNIYVTYTSGALSSPQYNSSTEYINFTGDSIITDYYGYDSASIINWESNTCDITAMSVVYIT